MDTLFKLVNGDVQIQSNMINSKNIKALIRRDRGGVMQGDANGNKKYRAFAELGLIWYCINLNSPGIQKGLDGKELVKDGITYFNLPDDWKADDAYNAVYDEYKEQYETSVVVRSIKSLLKGFDRSIKLMDKISNIINSLEDSSDAKMDDVSEFIKLNKELMNISSNLPDSVTKLKKLEETYLKEEKKITTGRGSQAITSSMDPN